MLFFRHNKDIVININAQTIARTSYIVVQIGFTLAAFLRGDHLLGIGCGVMYATVTIALFWLLALSRSSVGSMSITRVVFLLLFALPVGYAMAFPAAINPDVQFFIDKQSIDRRMRAELAKVFASDLAYRTLTFTSFQGKDVTITVRGSVSTRATLNRLRCQIAMECPARSECSLYWNVSIQNTGQQIDGSDRELFQYAE